MCRRAAGQPAAAGAPDRWPTVAATRRRLGATVLEVGDEVVEVFAREIAQGARVLQRDELGRDEVAVDVQAVRRARARDPAEAEEARHIGKASLFPATATTHTRRRGRRHVQPAGLVAARWAVGDGHEHEAAGCHRAKGRTTRVTRLRHVMSGGSGYVTSSSPIT